MGVSDAESGACHPTLPRFKINTYLQVHNAKAPAIRPGGIGACQGPGDVRKIRLLWAWLVLPPPHLLPLSLSRLLSFSLVLSLSFFRSFFLSFFSCSSALSSLLGSLPFFLPFSFFLSFLTLTHCSPLMMLPLPKHGAHCQRWPSLPQSRPQTKKSANISACSPYTRRLASTLLPPCLLSPTSPSPLTGTSPETTPAGRIT